MNYNTYIICCYVHILGLQITVVIIILLLCTNPKKYNAYVYDNSIYIAVCPYMRVIEHALD